MYSPVTSIWYLAAIATDETRHTSSIKLQVMQRYWTTTDGWRTQPTWKLKSKNKVKGIHTEKNFRLKGKLRVESKICILNRKTVETSKDWGSYSPVHNCWVDHPGILLVLNHPNKGLDRGQNFPEIIKYILFIISDTTWSIGIFNIQNIDLQAKTELYFMDYYINQCVVVVYIVCLIILVIPPLSFLFSNTCVLEVSKKKKKNVHISVAHLVMWAHIKYSLVWQIRQN